MWIKFHTCQICRWSRWSWELATDTDLAERLAVAPLAIFIWVSRVFKSFDEVTISVLYENFLIGCKIMRALFFFTAVTRGLFILFHWWTNSTAYNQFHALHLFFDYCDQKSNGHFSGILMCFDILESNLSNF